MVAAALDTARKTLPPIVASEGVEIEIHDGSGPPPPPMVVLQWSVWLIVHGRADVRIGGRSCEIRPGAVATARPGDVVSVERRRTDRMRVVHVTLWPEAVGGIAPTHAPLQSVTHDVAMTTTIHELVRVLGSTSPARLEARRTLAGIVLSLEPTAAKTAPAVERTRAILDEDYAHDHKLEDLARTAGVSKYHLIRAFHADLGVTPHAYLTAVRVAHARAKLRDGEKIPSVARALGFATASHLAKNFKRSFGMRPSQYARMARQDKS